MHHGTGKPVGSKSSVIKDSISDDGKVGSVNAAYDNGGAMYQNLVIPVNQLPVYIQKMKERGDGFQKEFQVSHYYVCL